MASSIGMRRLRENLSATLARVRRGETVEVTDRGRPVALIVPPPSEDRVARLIADGRLKPATRPFELPALVEPTGAITASQALADDRG
jgi:prevent-host-death family protein